MVLFWDTDTEPNPHFLKSLSQEIGGIAAHSDEVQKNGLFAALKGEVHDGHDHIPHALKRGAKVLLVDESYVHTGLESAPTIIKTKNPRYALALLCRAYFQPRPEACLMVTGTDGKTSTVAFCRQILAACGYEAASLGTLGVVHQSGETIKRNMTSLTTLDSVHLSKRLQELAQEQVKVVAMEASSHGISQGRLDGIEAKAAALTHIAHDHLDFHKTWQNYCESKYRLFERLSDQGLAVLPLDDTNGRILHSRCRKRHVPVFGFSSETMPDTTWGLQCLSHQAKQSHTLFHFNLRMTKEHRFEVALPMWGAFQSINLMAALGLAASVVSDPQVLAEAMSHVKPVIGRMQLVAQTSSGGRVFVDYAHTPGALSHALQAARSKGRLWVVFGCGGDRDKKKRGIMGQVATEKADEVMVTDDNPRREDPHLIRLAIRQGAPHAREVADRDDAIAIAIGKMSKQDTLVIAGKGHEQGQVIGTVTRDFDDAKIARYYAKRAGWQVVDEQVSG